MRLRPRRRSLAGCTLAVVAGSLSLAMCAVLAAAEPQVELPQPNQVSPRNQEPPQDQVPSVTLTAAVQWALEHNTALLTFRRNRGIAQAAIQIARQYPFNPIIQDFVWGASGPQSAGVTNPVFNEHTTRLDIEWRHQGRYRRAMAQAAMTRTEWEIAAQELLTAILVTRAFNTLLYRQEKYQLMEEGQRFTEEIFGYTKELFDKGTLKSADMLLARADIMDSRNLMVPARGVIVVAENDLRRTLGLVNEPFRLEGTLEKGFHTPPPSLLIQAGLERRPDVHALEYAIREAEQRRNLEVANRFGNPSLGPSMEVNETSVTFVGLWAIWQAPIINIRRGEIRQREAEVARARQALFQGETLVKQDVYAALARLNQAEKVIEIYNSQTLPTLRTMREEFDKLYMANQPGVDLARVIDIRRRLLRARDAYLDMLFELSQAQTDLAAAVSDLSLAGFHVAPSPPGNQPPREAAAPQQPAAPPGEQLPPPNPVPEKK